MSKTTIIALSIAISACSSTGSETTNTKTGELVVEMCGQSPVYPTISTVVDFSQSSVTITHGEYDRLVSYDTAMGVWLDCVHGL